MDFDTVRDIGLTLPGVEESTAYGFPALKVHGKLLACVPANPSAEPASLVRVDFDDRTELLAEAPDVYYVTERYVDTTLSWLGCPASPPICCEICLGYLQIRQLQGNIPFTISQKTKHRKMKEGSDTSRRHGFLAELLRTK